MKTKKVSSNTLLQIILACYKDDPEGLLSDLEITVAAEESLQEWANGALNCMEDEDDEAEVDYDEAEKCQVALVG